jgi:hypothetical protein
MKKKELERLLKEKKIELPQYLEMSAKLENASPSKEKTTSEKTTHSELLKTNLLLFVSPFLLLTGWFIVGLNPIQGYENTTSLYEIVGYPYSPIGLGIMMTAAILLSIGLANRWVKSVSRSGLIVSQTMGWFVLAISLFVLAIGFSEVWIQDTQYTWHNIVSINPLFSGFSLLLWFIGILTIAYGLVPSRKWLNKGIIE